MNGNWEFRAKVENQKKIMNENITDIIKMKYLLTFNINK